MLTELHKVDLKQDYKTFYTASTRQAAIVQVPNLRFLMFDGVGRPEEAGFQQAASSLYPVAYLLKFMIRERLGIDYGVMPMEVRYHLDRAQKGSQRFAWTMMLMQPAWVTPELFAEARIKAEAKVDDPAALARVRLDEYEEGLSAQILHAGPYEGMNATFARLKAQIEPQGYTAAPDTHDIYLNNALRTRPENLKAIVRVTLTPTTV